MTDDINGFARTRLRWLIGIEDTCVYPEPGSSMGTLNEFALTGHDTNWRSDIATAAEMGATGLRYGISWPLVHVAPGEFDWTIVDERIEFAVREHGLLVIADLVHYGTPTWLTDSFADERFPDALEDFATSFAARYRGIVDHITPLNEPLTTASFCGLRGVWPPALTGWSGWSTVAVGIARGVQRAIAGARQANPDVVIVHVEASAIYETADPSLTDEVELLRSLSTLPTDLILGRVDELHSGRPWLIEHGVPVAYLDELAADSPRIDLLGVNYYPDLTPRILEQVNGSVRQVTANRWSDGLRGVLHDWASRYELPLLVTETSIEGTEEVRRAWLEDSTSVVRDLHEEGVDVRGLTWWPLLDFVDWSFASGGRNVEEFVLRPEDDSAPHAETYAQLDRGISPFLRRMGLLTLDESEDGRLRRVPTAAADRFPGAADCGAAQETSG